MPHVGLYLALLVFTLCHSMSESSSCSTLPYNVPLQPSSESTSTTLQSVSHLSGAADPDPFPRPIFQLHNLLQPPLCQPQSLNHSCPILPRNGRRLTPFWHDVVPRILQASSIEDKDIGLVEGIFNYFAAAYGTKEKKRSCKKRQRKIASELWKAKEMKNDARCELAIAKKANSSSSEKIFIS